ncbi:MAG: hypothetical protein JRJ12_17605, partial [Deltaproteobacteria bacterium]|nr:hypothetical protein [Deltaproteobacteria bacterium]
RDKLQLLKDKGLKGILISVNPFYAEYVPFERTERCVRISKEVFGRNVAVYQVDYYEIFTRLGIKQKISLEDYLQRTGGESLTGRIELFLMGRAARKLRRFYRKHPGSCFFTVPCQPPLFRTWHNHFDNYGNFMPGYCGGISLGSWFEIDRLATEGIDLQEQPVLAFLIKGDFEGLFRFARDLGFQEREEGYVSKCDFCLHMREHLAAAGDFVELKPEGFYQHLT